MMSRGKRIGERCVGAALLAGVSCARFGYESLPNPVPDDTNLTYGGGFGGSSANAPDAASGNNSAGGRAASAGGHGGASSTIDAGDAASDTADSGASSGGTGGATLAGCEPGVATATWSFTSDTQGWQIEADPGANGTLSWTGAAGHPAPGALEIDATVADGVSNVRVYLDQSPSDLTGKVIYTRVFLASDSGASAKVFVQTGATAWGDGYEVSLDTGQWHCLTLDMQNPDVRTPGFDGTAVRRIGVFFFGDASPRLYVDHVAY